MDMFLRFFLWEMGEKNKPTFWNFISDKMIMCSKWSLKASYDMYRRLLNTLRQVSLEIPVFYMIQE